MALVLKDRVKQTAAAPGTGTITLSGTSTGFQTFASIGNGNTTYFAIVDPVSGDWEVSYGTYTSSGTTLSRTTVLSSSNSGSLVNFTGAVDVFVTYPSENAVWTDTTGVVNATSFGNITATSAALTTGTVSTQPSSNTDIANKQYVDTVSASGIHYHEPVYVESPDTAGNLNALYNQPGGAGVGVGATLTNNGTKAALTIDGVLMTVGKRVLIYNQTSQFQNGVYTVTTVGTPDPGGTNWVLTRATDADTYSPFSPNSLGQGDAFFVTNGNTGAGETYICNTVGTITFGTTAITFAQISDSTLYTAGTGLTLNGTEFSITPTGTAGTYGSASQVPVLTTNASGQVTGVTNTSIAINGSQVSGNISGSAGSVANALTAGSYLTSAGTFDGSAARTFAVDATSANTASKVVARDASGNFSAGTITAALSGNATTSTTSTNVAGGGANQIPYNTAAGTTSFITAPTTSGTYLGWNGSAFTYSAISTPNSLTMNSSGTGDASGTTFNGSAARTISYNTVGASPLAGSTSLTTTGTVTTGTWSALFGAVSGANLTNLTAGNLAGTIPSAVLGNSTAYIGTTAVALNRASANQALTGITSVTLPGSTSGTVQVIPAATAGTGTVLTLPATTGTAITSGDTGTVTNTMLAGSIADTKLSTISTAGKVANSATTATNANTASAIVARDASGNFTAGTITAALSGNATTATTATQVANSHSPGTYITGSAFNGSAAQTWAVDATSANTASKVVARDASGNFSAGTITATLSGNASTATSATSASSATTATTATNLAGGGAGTIPYQSAAGTTVQLTAGTSGYILQSNGAAAPSWVVASTAAGVNNGTLTMNVSGTGLSGSQTFTANQSSAATFTVTSNATSANTASTIVARDASGNFSAGTITATLSGNASTATSATTATTATNQSGGTVSATTVQASSWVSTSGPYYRNAAGTGYLNGQYSSVETVSTSGAIYSIGGSYVPGTTTLGNMYGIGYTYSGGAAGNPGGVPSSVWGMYVASSGVGRIFLDSDNGRGYFAGNLYVNGGTQVVYNSGTWSISVTGNAATAGGFTPSATAGTASRIVVADGSGYINNTYFNSTDNSVASGVSGVMVKAGDNYLRTGTAAAIATFISGQTMNISGSSTSCSGNAATATTATTATTANATNTANNFQMNSLGVGTAGSGTAGEIRATNNITAYYSSDIKFKENVRDIPNAAATAAAIGGKLFDWKDSYIEEHGGEDGYFVVKADFGVIAQDVLAKFPVAVRTRPDGSLAVDYEKLSALALAAVAEHEDRIAKLEALVAKLIEGQS